MNLAIIILLLCYIGALVSGHEHGSYQSQTEGNLRSRRHSNHQAHICGTPDPTEETLASLDRAVRFATLRSRRRLQGNESSANDNFAAYTPKKIPVCITVVGAKISTKQLNKEFAALNKAFSASSCCNSALGWCTGQCSVPNTNIQFVMLKTKKKKLMKWFRHIFCKKPSNALACVQWYENPTDMATDAGELEVKTAMRRGGADVLNIYYAPLTDDKEFYGYTPYVYDLLTNPILDGVVINRNVLVGGSAYPDRNQGHVLVHQVGHWLGLPHPFYGGCKGNNDGISDTAAARFANNAGCNYSPAKDTCTADGVDPVHNFMDYSTDECVYEWTAGQVEVMHATYDFYRTASSRAQPIQLTSGVASAYYSLAKSTFSEFTVTAAAPSTVSCQVSASNGDVDLYMNSNGDLNDFDCTSATFGPNETCSIPAVRTAYIQVYAWIATTDFSVLCTVT